MGLSVGTKATMMRRLTAALITVSLLSSAWAAPARAANVTISSCYDGDTCRTTSGERIRLACIDTPELLLLRCRHNQCLRCQ